MRSAVFAKHLSQANRSLLSILCCFLIIVVLWLGVCLDNRSIASVNLTGTKIVRAFDGAIASQPTVMENLKDKVKNDLSEKADSVGNYPDSVAPVIGQTKRRFDNSAQQVKSVENAVDGQSEENVAKIQGKATNSGRGVENAIEDVMSNIKNKVN